MTRSVTEYVLSSQRQKYTKPLTVKGSFLFLSDVEIPFHDARFLNDCIALARAYGIRQAVWGGDMLHLEAFSPFPGADADAEQEISEIDEYLPGLIEPFNKIYWMMGNHDQRVVRVIDRKIAIEQALRMFVGPDCQEQFRERVTLSPYFWCLAAHNWQLEHANNNSTIPTRAAQCLVAKYHKNVIQAHTHKAGAVLVNGLWAIESGCGVDVERLAYPNLRHSTHTAMQNGAVLMTEWGRAYVPTLLTPDRMGYELWRAKKTKR